MIKILLKYALFILSLLVLQAYSDSNNIDSSKRNHSSQKSSKPVLEKENASKIIINKSRGKVTVDKKKYSIVLSLITDNSFEVNYQPNQTQQLPSFAIDPKLTQQVKLPESTLSRLEINETDTQLIMAIDTYKLIYGKADGKIQFLRDDILLSEQLVFNEREKESEARKESKGRKENEEQTDNKMYQSFKFSLDDNEKLLGGGQRVLGMDRRGHRMPLYNRAHYGYETESNQMYFSLPAIMSNKLYAITYDNTASGFLDIGKTNVDELIFESVGGRSSYLFTFGESYQDLVSQLAKVTGKQPMPPRWAFGNYASRFGYRTEKQVRETIDKFIEEDIPVDTIILDLFWFGPDIKGHVGNLQWDKAAFPTPTKMIADLKAKGVKTIVITEPFVLSSSKKWNEAVVNKVLATDEKDQPYRFDFYFGNTGLIDVFDDGAQRWFWQTYEMLLNQGVAGTWGDLGEPEVHPDDIQHNLTDAKMKVRGDEIHNAYGHQWAKMVYENQRLLQPNERPFIMMRSGFPGSQRYGMIPWTGDVNRSWGGLKPQVELSLQMSLFGMAYTHSDLGGFAGGEKFNPELYQRWLQYGVFQPVYRPHAQDHIPPEPVFHDEETKRIVRNAIKLRYQMLPYNYTLAYQNSTTGMPLMRPLSFLDVNNDNYFDNASSYLWGDSLLVTPIVRPNQSEVSVALPQGTWFDFWNEKRYVGGKNILTKTSKEHIPVFVKAGAFIPMVASVQSTKDYSSENLTLHYYADQSVEKSSGVMYEDDGLQFDAISNNAYELFNFESTQSSEALNLQLTRTGGNYQGRPEKRTISLVIHGIDRDLALVTVNGSTLSLDRIKQEEKDNRLFLQIEWDHNPLLVNFAFK